MEMVHTDQVFPELRDWFGELVEIRHDIHSHPETGFETPLTVERIARHLRAWGISCDTEAVKGGVIAVIEGNRPGATIAFRTDIDALPMDDCSDNPWKSVHPGKAHACGHDGHQTWALGTLRYLAAHRDFPGRVIGIFQPAEEQAHGAKAVIKSGIFEKYGIKEIYGGHDEPMLPKGVFGFKTGHLQASADSFWITIHGKGTHGGRPHLGIDPVPVAAQLINALQTIPARKVNPIIPAVVSVCSVNAGRFETPNVVPHFATLSGTVRTFSEQARGFIEENIRKMAAEVSAASGCTCEVEYENQTASVNNDPALTRNGVETATRLFGADHVVPEMEPFLSSEDFAEYQLVVPGCMLRVGIADENHKVGVHNQAFDFNDEVLPAACTLFTTILLGRLNALAA